MLCTIIIIVRLKSCNYERKIPNYENDYNKIMRLLETSHKYDIVCHNSVFSSHYYDLVSHNYEINVGIMTY